MQTSKVTGCLSILVGLLLIQIVLASIFPDFVDGSALVRLFVLPLMLVTPWGLPVLMGWLLSRLGSNQRRASRIARAVSGISLALAVLFFSFVVAMAGRLVVPVREDAGVIAVLLAIAIAAGVYGFWRDKIPASDNSSDPL